MVTLRLETLFVGKEGQCELKTIIINPGNFSANAQCLVLGSDVLHDGRLGSLNTIAGGEMKIVSVDSDIIVFVGQYCSFLAFVHRSSQDWGDEHSKNNNGWVHCIGWLFGLSVNWSLILNPIRLWTFIYICIVHIIYSNLMCWCNFCVRYGNSMVVENLHQTVRLSFCWLIQNFHLSI